MSIELNDIAKSVAGETHIYPTTLALQDNTFNVLLGTTLSGKTTLMRLMAGLEAPTSGTIAFRGEDVTGVSVQKRNVSMVYQQFVNYPNWSVFDNIVSPLKVAGIGKTERNKRVREIAELLKLEPLLKRRPSELSGGQQQRTALARALVKDADLVLLDEPLANLDYKLREELRDELPKLLGGRGATVVYATSEPSEALLLGGHTATLHEGRVTQFGETTALYRMPNDLVTAQVFSDPPINTARVQKQAGDIVLNDRVRWTAREHAATLSDQEYIVGIRPHHITPVAHANQSVAIDAKVLITELSGSESIIHIDVDGQTWVSQSHGVHPLEIGTRTQMHVHTDRLLYFFTDGRLAAS